MFLKISNFLILWVLSQTHIEHWINFAEEEAQTEAGVLKGQTKLKRHLGQVGHKKFESLVV